MAYELSELLHLKHKLKCREDGRFRILMMSDVQETARFSRKTKKAMEALLDEAKPDLVVLGGDNCFGPEINTVEDFEVFLENLAQPMTERSIPWAHVFGNHDHDASAKIGIMPQQLRYEASPMCVSKHMADCSASPAAENVTTFVLPVLSHDEKDVVFNVWGFDGGKVCEDLRRLTGDEAFIWSFYGFEQLRFYWDSSVAFEKLLGHKVPGLVCQHIAPEEYKRTTNEPEKYHLTGYKEENIWTSAVNSGLVNLMVQRGDIKAICCGHTHNNDFQADFCHIKFCFDGCIGYTCYGNDGTRGGRVFDIDENGGFHTFMIHMRDIPDWDRE